MELKTIFKAVLERYNISEFAISDLWNEIEANYSLPGRYYHTLQHLSQILRVIKPIELIIKEKDAFYLAVFYHDIIYNSQVYDNEKQSAAFAVARLQKNKVPQKTIDLCEIHIEATKSHAFHSNPDTNLLLDADLAILGSSSKRYFEYKKQIRCEYSDYSYFQYKTGRKKVL